MKTITINVFDNTDDEYDWLRCVYAYRGKVSAIKLYRNLRGKQSCGLLEAKYAIEDMFEEKFKHV